MKRKKDVSRSGETLVEIMVSAVVFLILVGILQGAIVFCSNAQRRSEQLRRSVRACARRHTSRAASRRNLSLRQSPMTEALRERKSFLR